jgi:hypothetical protein
MRLVGSKRQHTVPKGKYNTVEIEQCTLASLGSALGGLKKPRWIT